MLATGVGGACGAFLVLILLPFVCEEMEDVRECVGEVDIMDDLRGPWGGSRANFPRVLTDAVVVWEGDSEKLR